MLVLLLIGLTLETLKVTELPQLTVTCPTSSTPQQSVSSLHVVFESQVSFRRHGLGTQSTTPTTTLFACVQMSPISFVAREGNRRRLHVGNVVCCTIDHTSSWKCAILAEGGRVTQYFVSIICEKDATV